MRPGRTKKATFRFTEDVLKAIDEAVVQGAAPSRSAFVERAVMAELRWVRRRMLEQRWEMAAGDPLFRRDLDAVGAAFAQADAETARQIS